MAEKDKIRDSHEFNLDDLIRNYRGADDKESSGKKSMMPGSVDQDLSTFIMQHYDRVLLLERNASIGEAAFRLLKAEGYNVEWETDRNSALETLKAEDFRTGSGQRGIRCGCSVHQGSNQTDWASCQHPELQGFRHRNSGT